MICPKDRGYQRPTRSSTAYRSIAIHCRSRHGAPQPISLSIRAALFSEFLLSLKIWRRHGFDVIHACNPPDLIFLIGLFFKFFAGKSFVFDHHDANPEFYEAKFGRRGFLWKLLRIAEKLTFKAADISIATNDSYRRIAIDRGGMRPERVFVVRSGPNLDRVKTSPSRSSLGARGRQIPCRLCGRDQPIRGPRFAALLDQTTSSHAAAGKTFTSWWRAAARNWRPSHKRAENMNLADYVTFTGRIDDARALHDVVHGRRLRKSRPRYGHERHLHHEQDHGVHGAGQSPSSNSTSRRDAFRLKTHPSTPGQRSHRFRGENS